MIRLLLAVTLGGVIGTLLRFGVGQWVTAHWPRQYFLATLLVNLLGCLAIGYAYVAFAARPEIAVHVRQGVMLGFLGALTTFSSFSLDTLRLLEAGQLGTVLFYVSCSVLGGLIAASVGLWLGRL